MMYICAFNGGDYGTKCSTSEEKKRIQNKQQAAIRYPKQVLRFISLMCIGHADILHLFERWGAGVETQKNVLGEIGGWGRVPFNETYAPSLSTIYDGA